MCPIDTHYACRSEIKSTPVNGSFFFSFSCCKYVIVVGLWIIIIKYSSNKNLSINVLLCASDGMCTEQRRYLIILLMSSFFFSLKKNIFVSLLCRYIRSRCLCFTLEKATTMYFISLPFCNFFLVFIGTTSRYPMHIYHAVWNCIKCTSAGAIMFSLIFFFPSVFVKEKQYSACVTS